MDQEPKNLFEIDDETGVIRSKRPLDREKFNSFTVRLAVKNDFQTSRGAQSAEGGYLSQAPLINALLMHGTRHQSAEFFKPLVCVSAWRRWNDEGRSSSQKQPEVNFQGAFMSVMGDILKCFKPDDCDVTLNLEANILHVSPVRFRAHVVSRYCSPSSSGLDGKEKKPVRDKVSGIVITFICFDCVFLCAAESLCTVAQRRETGESNHNRDRGPGSK